MGYAAMYQTNVAGYVRTCASTASLNCVLGLNVTAQDVSKTATGFTARRITAEADRCNNCHGKLGLFTETTSTAVSATIRRCARCATTPTAPVPAGRRTPRPSSMRSMRLASVRCLTYGTRTRPSTPARSASGVLSNCENCHAPGGYDFSAGASQVRTACTGLWLLRRPLARSTHLEEPVCGDEQRHLRHWLQHSDAAATTPSRRRRVSTW